MQAGTARKGAALTAMNTTIATTSRYLIHANGTTKGVYLATSRDDALDACAQDAGYDAAEDMLQDFSDDMGRTADERRADWTVEEIGAIVVDVTSVGHSAHTPGCIDSGVTIAAGRLAWKGAVTLAPDRGHPKVGRRHPLGTCGTPLDGWASDGIREALRVLGDDLIGEIEHAVDTAARKAGL